MPHMMPLLSEGTEEDMMRRAESETDSKYKQSHFSRTTKEGAPRVTVIKQYPPPPPEEHTD